MKRLMLVLPALVLLAGLAFGGGYFVMFSGDNAPAPVVTAHDLQPGPLEQGQADNQPLETPEEQEAQPAPEPEVKEQPKVAPEPKTEPEATTNPAVEAIRLKLQDELNNSDLSDEDKKLKADRLAKALAELESKLAENGVTISGRVVDPAGQPVAGASVVANSQIGGDEAVGRRRAPSQRTVATTDEEGNFTGIYYAPSEAALKLDLLAQHSMFLPSERETIEVTPGTACEGVTLVVKQAAGITGRVVDSDFNPINNARVIVLSADRRWRGRTQAIFTDTEGKFAMGGLTAGEYRISVTCIGYKPPMENPTITIVEGPPTPLASDIVMTTQTSVKLKLTSANGQPRGYFMVTFFLPDGKTRKGSGLAEADGTALVQNAPLDATEMVVQMRGYETSERVRISVYEGAHSDAGEVSLTAAEEVRHPDFDSIKPEQNPDEDPVDKAERLKKIAEKLRGGKR